MVARSRGGLRWDRAGVKEGFVYMPPRVCPTDRVQLVNIIAGVEDQDICCGKATHF